MLNLISLNPSPQVFILVSYEQAMVFYFSCSNVILRNRQNGRIL